MENRSDLRILFLITARGGSKGVPGKNLREIAGIPLVGYKAISALRSKYCTRLIISTDSPQIQQVASSYGAEVLFTRPHHLATDTATSAEVIWHAMEFIASETTDRYDAVMLLEPSTPLTRPCDYDRAMEIMAENDANLVVSVREMEVNSAFVGAMDNRGRIAQIIEQSQQRGATRRQDLPPEYTVNGGLYLFKWDYFKQHKTMYNDREKSFGYVMDRHYSVEIDEIIDLHWVEFLVDHGYVDLSYWQ